MNASSWLAADAEAVVGQDYHYGFSGIPEDAANVTLDVVAPNGLMISRRFAPGVRFESSSVPVTLAWGSGEGFTRLRFDNGTGSWEERLPFRTECPPACALRLVEEANARSAGAYLAFAGVSALVSVVLLGHAAAVYAVRAGEVPWTTRVALAARSKVSRDPLARSKEDPLGLLPEPLRQEIRGIQDAVVEAHRLQQAAARAWARVRRKAYRAARDADPPPDRGGAR